MVPVSYVLLDRYFQQYERMVLSLNRYRWYSFQRVLQYTMHRHKWPYNWHLKSKPSNLSIVLHKPGSDRFSEDIVSCIRVNYCTVNVTTAECCSEASLPTTVTE